MESSEEAVMQYVVAELKNWEAEEEKNGGGEGGSRVAAALAALCDVLAMAEGDLFGVFSIGELVARLPRLVAGGEGDVPLFAARAIAEACEGVPQWAPSFVRYSAVQALRDRLLAIDCIDLAEECLRALNIISMECPKECLSHGVAAAVLQFFDFFSMNKQKLVLKIVAKVLSDFDEKDAPKAMEAAPVLCNLLQSTDKTILDSAVSCLVMVSDGARDNAKHMEKLYELNAVQSTMRLMENDGWKSLSDETLSGILGLLKDLACLSARAVKSLFELNICDLLKEMITYYTSSHSDHNKVQTLVELIYYLMPPLEMCDHRTELIIAKKNVIMEQSRYIEQLASILTFIIELAKSAALSSICYSCAVVIRNIVELSTPSSLVEVQKTVNLSSLLASWLARKNRHIVFQTLNISKTLLNKQHKFFFEVFSREGVKQAIDTIIAQIRDTNSNQKQKGKSDLQESCLCFDLDLETSTDDTCKIDNRAILKLSEEIKKNFLVKGSAKSPHSLGCAFKSIKQFFSRLNGHATAPPVKDQELCKELSDISRQLLSDELPSTSTFEFVQSGSIKHLAGYLSNGTYFNSNLRNCQDLIGQLKEVQSRLQKFTHLALSVDSESSVKPLDILVEKLIDGLHVWYDSFPVILADEQCTRASNMIPLRDSGTGDEPTPVYIKFSRSTREEELEDYNSVLPVDLYSTPESIEEVLLADISAYKENTQEANGSRKSVGLTNGDGHKSSRLQFSYKGTKLRLSAPIFESILQSMHEGQTDIQIDSSFWDKEHKIVYKRRNKSKKISSQSSYNTQLSRVYGKLEMALLKDPFFSTILTGKLPGDLDESDPSYNFLFMLKVLEGLNRFSYHLLMDEKLCQFAEGYLQELDDLKVTTSPIPRDQFVSSLLTNKLEQQMQDRLFGDGLIPSWCYYLVENCPFLVPFESRWKYFCLTAHHSFMTEEVSSSTETKKYSVIRSNILEDAASMMNKHGSDTKTIEVEFDGEVGTGRGPTFEFYTTVSHELQRVGLGMWRGDNTNQKCEAGFVHAPFGLFPQPWSSEKTSSRGINFSDVIQRFKLLGHLVARAVLDGRVLDVPLSKAFYKIMLGQELDIYDIPSFDPELGKSIIEFKALVKRKKFFEGRASDPKDDFSYKNMRLEDLCLDFTLPGNPEYELIPGGSEKMVTLNNLEEYVSSLADATLKSGISNQIEAFKAGINEVFALKTLQLFSEDEMERILCGEQDSWASSKLEDHIDFDHGYDANSPSVISFLEILREFGREDQRAFMHFTTGAPQLPLGGLASLDPKLTVVRKQCDGKVDDELPSVNTCRHFFKLPPYSSKEIMRQKLKYAIKEGLGSFQLS
uniref:HECT-type E3 ubiquitin transferase n=1 Tax=Leersia perrieri TaxID=77586 RepID=A0A0D9WC73_9ORYZ